MISQRHPDIAASITSAINNASSGQGPALFQELANSRETLITEGFANCPTWEQAQEGARPPQPEEIEPGEFQHGWQFFAASTREQFFREGTLLPNLSASRQALLRSQSGPGAGAAFSALPTSPLTTFSSQSFRVLLLRRLRLPLPPSVRTCRCGRVLDNLGDHRASCPRAGVLAGRGFALEAAAARICREAGARVVSNCMVRDLNLDVPPGDARLLEVVANNLPLWNGAQLAIDTTFVSSLRSDGSPIPHAPLFDGVALQRARRRKERTYPELLDRNGRVRLVVLAIELGGRWSSEASDFLKQLARAKARSVPIPA